jgi:hypothetical protein
VQRNATVPVPQADWLRAPAVRTKLSGVLRARNGLRTPRWSAAVGVESTNEKSVVEDVPTDRASTLLVIKDQLSEPPWDFFLAAAEFADHRRLATLG